MGGRSHAHAFDHDRMVAGPAASSVVQVTWRTEDGIMNCYGTSLHTVLEAEAADTYAPGCIYVKALAAGSSVAYINVGASGAVADFEAITSS
jgi:hypothetical protein